LRLNNTQYYFHLHNVHLPPFSLIFLVTRTKNALIQNKHQYRHEHSLSSTLSLCVQMLKPNAYIPYLELQPRQYLQERKSYWSRAVSKSCNHTRGNEDVELSFSFRSSICCDDCEQIKWHRDGFKV